MKIKLLMMALFGLITITAFAQKGELSNAQSAYEKYDGLVRGNYMIAKPSLLEAKTSIDKASANAKTATLPQTYALKAAIYASLASKDTIAATAATETATAEEAIKKAKETDTKNEFAKLTQHANLELAQIQLDKGVKAYQAKKFDEAYAAFGAAQKMIPDDTTAMLYTGVSAANAKNYGAAIENYNKLLTTNYSGKDKIYSDLPGLYLANKDTAGAVKIASEGAAKYPNDANLRREEIEVSLQSGHASDLLTKVEAAIKSDPQNKTLYYYEGLTYSQIAEAAGADITKIKKAAAKAAKAKPGVKVAPDPQLPKLQQTRTDNYGKAAEQYKKALALDPNYFEANMNMGYVTIAPTLDLYNETQQLPVNETKLYDANMAKIKTQLDISKPYLLKAVELNPKSVDALTNLKSYYLAKQDNANANEVQKKLDAVGGK